MKLTPDYPPVWLAGFMAAAWGVAQVHAPLGDALIWPGRALIALGLAAMVWAAVEFRRAQTTIIPHEMPSALVEGGPFRYSRNPIYLADLVILAGWCLSLGAPVGLLLIWPLKTVLERRFILPEEQRLEAHMGAPYRAYLDRVRRWL